MRSVTKTMLVWDTGTLIGLTPFCSDFILITFLGWHHHERYCSDKLSVRDWNHHVEASYDKGVSCLHPVVAYHMPDCDIHLFSPQSYFNLYGGDATVTAWSVVMHLPDNHVVNIPFDPTVNLHVIPHPQPTFEEQDNFGPHLLSSIVANDTPNLSGLATLVCYKTVADVSNNNLLSPQRS